MDANNCEMDCSIISKYQPLLYLSTVDRINVTLPTSLLTEEVSTHIASSSYSDPDIRHPLHLSCHHPDCWLRDLASSPGRLNWSGTVTLLSSLSSVVIIFARLRAAGLVTVTNCAQKMDAELSNLGTITSNSV